MKGFIAAGGTPQAEPVSWPGPAPSRGLRRQARPASGRLRGDHCVSGVSAGEMSAEEQRRKQVWFLAAPPPSCCLCPGILCTPAAGCNSSKDRHTGCISGLEPPQQTLTNRVTYHNRGGPSHCAGGQKSGSGAGGGLAASGDSRGESAPGLPPGLWQLCQKSSVSYTFSSSLQSLPPSSDGLLCLWVSTCIL